MMSKQIIALVALAAEGVEYTAAYGAVCPACNAQKLKVYCSKPVLDGFRERYHRCRNSVCPLANMGTSIKSIQVVRQLKAAV
jgi:hypothetical protein